MKKPLFGTYLFTPSITSQFMVTFLITQPVDGAVLHQAQVVLGQRGDEDDGAHVLEAVNPLPPLRPLTPDIHKPEVDLTKLQHRLLQVTLIILFHVCLIFPPSLTWIPVVALRILIMSSELGVKEGPSSLSIWVRKYRAESGNLNRVRLSRVERNLRYKTF